MAALTVAQARTEVLEAIGRVDGDTQCPATAIDKRIDTAFRRLRRRLAFEFPSLYEAVSTPETITADVLSKPADFEAVRVIEKQYGTFWVTLGALPSLNRDDCQELAFYELGSVFKITPITQAPGTYRMFYTTAPASNYTTMDLPLGLEDIVIAEVAAWASERHEERERTDDLRKEAKRIWDEQYMTLWNRFGSHSNSGMNIARP